MSGLVSRVFLRPLVPVPGGHEEVEEEEEGGRSSAV